jgi:hypothetical protein
VRDISDNPTVRAALEFARAVTTQTIGREDITGEDWQAIFKQIFIDVMHLKAVRDVAGLED